MNTQSARLILLPVPLGPQQSPLDVLPAMTLAHFRHLDHFIVENAKVARAFLKPLIGDRPIQNLAIVEWNEHSRHERPAELLAPAIGGQDIGLLSDAGCPAVADPGSDLVAAAHRIGIPVVPAVGPSSLLLALMSSGMGGQRFGFVGYLPSDTQARDAALRQLEQRSHAAHETILFIETPYRNQAMLDAAIRTLAPDTRLMFAAGLSLAEESVISQPLAWWRSDQASAARRADPGIPAVFGLRASSSAPAGPGGNRRLSAQTRRAPKDSRLAQRTLKRRT